MTKFARALIASLLVSGGSVASASTVTMMENGDNYTIDSGGPYIANVVASGGAGNFTVEFESSTDPFTGIASATIGNITLGTFSDLTLSWLPEADGAADTDNPLETIAFIVGTTTLTTEFSVPNMTQYLQVAWTDSLDDAGFDLQVTAVPLPASVLFLGAGIGGLALVSRRRKKVA